MLALAIQRIQLRSTSLCLIIAATDSLLVTFSVQACSWFSQITSNQKLIDYHETNYPRVCFPIFITFDHHLLIYPCQTLFQNYYCLLCQLFSSLCTHSQYFSASAVSWYEDHFCLSLFIFFNNGCGRLLPSSASTSTKS